MFMKKVTCVVLACMILLAGCAGRKANPVDIYLPGDEDRSCEAYVAEMAQLEADMDVILPDTSKAGQNTLCLVGGAFLLIPFFFMDLSNADKVEWDALRQRRNRLLVYAGEKGCDFGEKEYVPIPSLKEMKKLAKEQKKAEAQKD